MVEISPYVNLLQLQLMHMMRDGLTAPPTNPPPPPNSFATL